MAMPALRIRIAPKFPSKIQGSGGISVTRTGGVVTIDGAGVRPAASEEEAIEGIDNFKTMTPLRTAQSITVNAEGANFTAAGPVVASQSLRDKARRVVDVEDYYVSTDLGKMGPALGRALAQSGVKRINFGADTYTFDATVSIQRSNIAICGPGDELGELVVSGSSPLLFDIGSDSERAFHVSLSGLVISRTSSAAGSKVARIRNASYFKLKDSRFYLDNKWGSALDIQSGIYHDYSELRFENSIDHTVEMAGGSGAGGALNGWLVGHRWERCVFAGANAGKASPQSQASVIMNDHVSAVWMRDCEGYSHLGALVDMRGTAPNLNRNTLCLLYNLNAEATFANSCAVRVGNYANTEIASGWLSGNAMPGIVIAAGANYTRVVAPQIGATAGDAVSDAGYASRIEDVEIVGYSSGAAGVRFLSGSSNGLVRGGKIDQMASGVVNEAGDNASHHVVDISMRSVATPVSGFAPGNNKVERILNHDASPYYVRSSATLDLPFGIGDRKIEISGTSGNCDNIRAGKYFGERLTCHFTTTGMVVRDISLAGGNIVLTPASDTVTSDGRLIMTFEWNAGTPTGQWWCVSTNLTP